MSELSIVTPRGIRLGASLNLPVVPNNCVVIFAHDFLAERSGGHRYDAMAALFRRAGYATLQFDFSGVGESEDDVVTLAGEIEDLRSVSAWAFEEGYKKQFIVSTSFGALVALSAELEYVKSVVAIDPMFASLNYDWDSIFPSEQLEDLSKNGVTKIYDDSPTSRKYFIISKQTLIDLSTTNLEEKLVDLKCPILILVTDYDNYNDVLSDFMEKHFSKLVDGSKVEIIHNDMQVSKNINEILADISISWCDLRAKV